MTWRARWLWGVLALAGCDDSARQCLPGDYMPCACDSGERGFALCDAEGSAYGSCEYCGTSPLSQGGGGGGVTGGGGGGGGGDLLPFMAACEMDAECATGLCYPFNAKGPHCSHGCEAADDCEAPSPGCNGMGVCKVP